MKMEKELVFHRAVSYLDKKSKYNLSNKCLQYFVSQLGNDCESHKVLSLFVVWFQGEAVRNTRRQMTEVCTEQSKDRISIG